jgi:hypothetical protein
MYLVMTYLGVRTASLGKTPRIHIDAKRDKARDFQLLEMNNLASLPRRFTLPWGSGLLERIGSR